MKQITKTPEMLDQIRKVAGDGVDAASLPVYESVSANTLPLSKRGSIYNKGRMTEGLLASLSKYINDKGVPLHTMHDTNVLPIGKTFAASVVQNDSGLPEMRTLFYVSPVHADLVNQLDDGSIDEVSVGYLPASALCSECGFDFLGPDATLDNWYDRECPNGHVIGTDGAHVTMPSMAAFYEQSLVPNGAVQGAKVVSGSRARLTASVHEHHPVNGLDISAVAIFASATPAPKKPDQENTMDLMPLVTELADTKTQLALAEVKVSDIEAAHAATQAKLAELELKLAGIPQPTEVETKLSQLTAEQDATVKFLRVQAEKALIATGGDVALAEKMGAKELQETIESAQAKLSSLFPAGGRALSASQDDTTNQSRGVDRDAFRAHR